MSRLVDTGSKPAPLQRTPTAILLDRATMLEAAQREREIDARNAKLTQLVSDEYVPVASQYKAEFSWSKLVDQTVVFVERVGPALASLGFALLKGEFKLELALDLMKAILGGVLHVPLDVAKGQIKHAVERFFPHSEDRDASSDSERAGETEMVEDSEGQKDKAKRGCFSFMRKRSNR